MKMSMRVRSSRKRFPVCEVAIDESGASITRTRFAVHSHVRVPVGAALSESDRQRDPLPQRGGAPNHPLRLEGTARSGNFRCKTTESESSRSSRSKFLESLSVSIARLNIPVLAWAWRSASGSSNAPEGGSGLNRNPEKVRRFILRSPAEMAGSQHLPGYGTKPQGGFNENRYRENTRVRVVGRAYRRRVGARPRPSHRTAEALQQRQTETVWRAKPSPATPSASPTPRSTAKSPSTTTSFGLRCSTAP